jgi:Cu(I)/Ag(I) efflux system membrane fusion protein
MNRGVATLVLTVLALLGCRSKPQSDSMGDMTMTAAAPAGTDTGHAQKREPVHLAPAQARALGVTYTVVERGALARVVRTVGQVVAAEPLIADVTPKFDGFVEKLYVDATGLAVHRGQALLTVYGPMLVAAQEELLIAKRLAASVDSSDADAWRGAQTLLVGARRRLGYWDISEAQIEQIERTGEVTKTLTLTAPFDGVVIEKMVVAGQAVMPGVKLYRLADLSTVWIEGDVFEQDLGLIPVGAPARVEVSSYPGHPFSGRVSFVAPVVDAQSRAGRVRVALPNPGGLLKPGMNATLLFEARLGADVLNLPAEAVVMTGERNVVFVVGRDGALDPRDVTLGLRAGARVQILGGLKEGERVVASANFLVDAESRLGSAGGMADMPGMNADREKKHP